MSFLATWQFWVVVSLLIISGISKAIQDTLMFHFETSVFKNTNPNFWDPNKSWQNKYLISNNKFISWLFQNPLVSLTDGWHLFGLIRNFTMFASIPVISGNWWLFLLYPIFTGTFHIFFTWIFKTK